MKPSEKLKTMIKYRLDAQPTTEDPIVGTIKNYPTRAEQYAIEALQGYEIAHEAIRIEQRKAYLASTKPVKNGTTKELYWDFFKGSLGGLVFGGILVVALQVFA